MDKVQCRETVCSECSQALASAASFESVSRIGAPLALSSANSRTALEGVNSEGLTTIVQPAASAAASFQPMNSSG